MWWKLGEKAARQQSRGGDRECLVGHSFSHLLYLLLQGSTRGVDDLCGHCLGEQRPHRILWYSIAAPANPVCRQTPISDQTLHTLR
jgi:hypothetical protein